MLAVMCSEVDLISSMSRVKLERVQGLAIFYIDGYMYARQVMRWEGGKDRIKLITEVYW